MRRVLVLAGLLGCAPAASAALFGPNRNDPEPIDVDFRIEPVVSAFEATDLWVGDGYTCAALTDGFVHCWGRALGMAPGVIIGRVGAIEPVHRWLTHGIGAGRDAAGRSLRFDSSTAFRGDDRLDCTRDPGGRVYCRWTFDDWGDPLAEAPPCLHDADAPPRCPGARPLEGVRDVAISSASDQCPRPAWSDVERDPDSGMRAVHILDAAGRIGVHCTLVDRWRWRWYPLTGFAVGIPWPFVGDDAETSYRSRYGFLHGFVRWRPELGRAEALASARGVLCARRDAATVDCWGEAADELRPFARREKNVRRLALRRALPARIEMDASRGLEASRSHVCGLGQDRRIRCVGWNTHGQLGAPPPRGAPRHVWGDRFWEPIELRGPPWGAVMWRRMPGSAVRLAILLGRVASPLLMQADFRVDADCADVGFRGFHCAPRPDDARGFPRGAGSSTVPRKSGAEVLP